MRKVTESLIPEKPNTSPDYYCTWQTQLYATSDGKPQKQRDVMTEHSLFCEEKPFGWAYFHPRARKDLMLVMDDSWDVPVGENEAYYGSLLPDKGKFPGIVSENAAESLARLNEKIRALGWRGVGGWVCAQECERYTGILSAEEYWIERFRQANASGFAYWKVDWGKRAADVSFRRRLSELAREYAPSLVLENAIRSEVIPYSDAYRTYDVPEIMSIPMTMEKLAALLMYETVPPAHGILNCEDEVYIAASLGCAMGVMRHPYAGAFPDGRADMSFPACHRDVKRRMDEVARAAIWHRAAPAFAVSARETQISAEILTDYWRFDKVEEEIEAWWLTNPMIAPALADGILTKSAPAAISRGLPLPECAPNADGKKPYLTASRAPNGVVSLATLGRTEGRSFAVPRCAVRIEAAGAHTFGLFGAYESVTLCGVKAPKTVLAQDILGKQAWDVTDSVQFTEEGLVIPGALIEKIGTEQNEPGDISDAGLAVRPVDKL